MSKRKRHTIQKTGIQHIEWFQHRTGYPSPEEREKIIRMRGELSLELIKSMVMGIKPGEAEVQALARRYTPEEVERAIRVFKETMEFPSLVADDAKSYREYRHRYARFGAGLQFYTAKQIDELYETHLEQLKESHEGSAMVELNKLLLFGWRDWEDLTPPAIPPQPDNFNAPQPASYPARINELLEWGDDLHRSNKFIDEQDFLHWKKYSPALTRMAFDKGLINGWPTEPATWAPWHAIHMLGTLQAWESAPALASLADLENDWLSDHLPHIWADMGMEVEPSLWMILENTSTSVKQRGLAAQSLRMMTDDDDVMQNKVIKGFEKMLGNTKTYNPTVNAYLIHFLNEMDAVEDVWDAIESAFDEDRVDTDIITPEDLEQNEFDDEIDDEFDNEDDE